MTNRLEILRVPTVADAVTLLQPPIRALVADRERAALQRHSPPPFLTLRVEAAASDGCSFKLGHRLLDARARWPIAWSELRGMLGQLPKVFHGEVMVVAGLLDVDDSERKLVAPCGISPAGRSPQSASFWRSRSLAAENSERFWQRAAKQAHGELIGMAKGGSALIHAAADLVQTTRAPPSSTSAPTQKSVVIESLAAGATGALLDRLGVGGARTSSQPAIAETASTRVETEWVRSIAWMATINLPGQHEQPPRICLERRAERWTLWHLDKAQRPKQLGLRPTPADKLWRRERHVLEWVVECLQTKGVIHPKASAIKSVHSLFSWEPTIKNWETMRLAPDGQTKINVQLSWKQGSYKLCINRGEGRQNSIFDRPGPDEPRGTPGPRVLAWAEGRIGYATGGPGFEHYTRKEQG